MVSAYSSIGCSIGLHQTGELEMLSYSETVALIVVAPLAFILVFCFLVAAYDVWKEGK